MDKSDKWADIANARNADPDVVAQRAAYDAEQTRKRAAKRKTSETTPNSTGR